MPEHVEQLDRLQAALADRYRIEHDLGRGALANVYLAQDLKNERPVAIKVLKPEKVRSQLRKLGYADQDIEGKFIPALLLRNEFDVGHVSLALLTNQQLRTLHRYTNLAENAFRDLLKGVLSQVSAGEYRLPTDPSLVLPGDKRKILQRLGKALDSVEPKQVD